MAQQAAMASSPSPRFMADAMLGRLARWLRMLGYDTAYEKIISDERVIEWTLHENRCLLTRDWYLAQRKILRGRCLLIASDHLDSQLRELQRGLHLDLDPNEQRPFRCANCNVIPTSVSPTEVIGLVPPYVALHFDRFAQCPSCRRVYWPGTHWEAVVGRLSAIRNTEGDRFA
jgi:uncharacterized protein with PIN domain